MKILVLSTLYPNAVQRRHGVFIEHRTAHVADADHHVRVLAPVPWFPFRSEKFGAYADYAAVPAHEERRGFAIDHPRYPTIPKVGMTAAPFLMAAALAPHLAKIRADGFDFDVIDSYYLYPDGVAAALLGKWFDRPVVMSALGTDVSLIPNWRLQRAMILWAVRQAGAVTTVAAALRDALIDLGAAPDKLAVVEHGVDLDLFQPPADRAASRCALGIDGPAVLSVGHLIDRKGHDFAIQAVASLPGVRLLIAGDGPRDAALRKLASDLGVSDRVNFLGHVDQARLPELYGAVDATLNCSDREGIANVLLESLACGTPLVATRVWGSPEVIRVPEAGLLVNERSGRAIADGIARTLASPPDRAMTRAFGELYHWDETGRQHRAQLAKAVDGYRRRRAIAAGGVVSA